MFEVLYLPAHVPFSSGHIFVLRRYHCPYYGIQILWNVGQTVINVLQI